MLNKALNAYIKGEKRTLTKMHAHFLNFQSIII